MKLLVSLIGCIFCLSTTAFAAASTAGNDSATPSILHGLGGSSSTEAVCPNFTGKYACNGSIDGKKVDFTINTFVTGATFMTLAGKQFNELAELDGRKVGVVKGTTTEETLKKLLKDTLTNASVVTYNSAKEALDGLRGGEIRAFTSDQVVLIGLILTAKDKENFAISPQVFSFEPFALAVKRNNADFRLIADSALSQLYRTGQIVQIYSKWFGGFAKEMPPMHQALYQLNATPE